LGILDFSTGTPSLNIKQYGEKEGRKRKERIEGGELEEMEGKKKSEASSLTQGSSTGWARPVL
jgi:hypothetical protein